MHRISDIGENESMQNVRDAYDNYSKNKHHRHSLQVFEKRLDANLQTVLEDIIKETWTPSPYKEKVIYEKKIRRLGIPPIYDHVIEAATILPYEQKLYDYIAWQSPAVRPNMGTNGLLRILRNDLFRNTQEECMYYAALDIHHYFPRMDHQILKDNISRKVKEGKLRRFWFKVIDSYKYGSPLGIKISQLSGMLYLAPFDRLVLRCFDIIKDQDKLAYWTSRYITDFIATAKSADEEQLLSQGTQFLANRFRGFLFEGIKHYFRFVDNIIVIHRDKTFLHIILELIMLHLTRDYHAIINNDYTLKPVWTGIHICGYVFYNDKVLLGKRNKQNLCRHVTHLFKCGLGEEQIRINQASLLGFAKHVNCVHLIKSLGMETTLGKIIKNRRIKSPFEGMTSDQKMKFSSICKTLTATVEGWDKKIYLEDYKIETSKIEKNSVVVSVPDSFGNMKNITKMVPGKVMAIKFKKIIGIKQRIGEDGAPHEVYSFEKVRDKNGNPGLLDAEYYSYTGSKILIDQAENDFTHDDLPSPTVIKQFVGKKGQTFFKFT